MSETVLYVKCLDQLWHEWNGKQGNLINSTILYFHLCGEVTIIINIFISVSLWINMNKIFCFIRFVNEVQLFVKPTWLHPLWPGTWFGLSVPGFCWIVGRRKGMSSTGHTNHSFSRTQDLWSDQNSNQQPSCGVDGSNMQHHVVLSIISRKKWP